VYASQVLTGVSRWGLAAYYAYVAYNDTGYLQAAKDAWEVLYTRFVTDDVAAQKALSNLPAVRSRRSCNGSEFFNLIEKSHGTKRSVQRPSRVRYCRYDLYRMLP
jgi:hypothetical protein